MSRSNASAAATVSPKISTSEWGIVPVGLRPASRAPAGVDAPDAAADDRRVVQDVRDVRVHVARPEARSRAAAPPPPRTARAAVAQPVDWESMPSIAVSYSANAR